MLSESDLSRADLNLLVLFQVVLEERHVARAAERLNLSPSAVSHSLTRLRRLLNDPLFLRTPKGVVPTARAEQLALPIADLLARASSIIASAEPFDPATSRRRFMLGAPDGVAAGFLPPLLAAVRDQAPGIDIGIRQILPAPARSWDLALVELDDRVIDVAVLPVERPPARFSAVPLFEEEFVIAMRAGHPFGKDPSLDNFCAMEHVVVSQQGDAHGFVDDALAELGRRRRIALTVPHFMFAMGVVAETDLISALPSRFVTMQSRRFGVESVASPLPTPIGQSRLFVVAPRAATMDAGISWLIDLLAEVTKRAPQPL